MKHSRFFAGLVTTMMVMVPMVASAQTFGSKYLNEVGKKEEVSGLTRATLPDIVARLLNVVISVLGLVLLGYLIWAGYLWMTAQGDDKQVVRAKDMIKNAVIGLVLVAISFGLTNFILTRLNYVTTGTAPVDVAPR